MDPVPLVYYGAVCGLLGLAAPRIGNGLLRTVVGIVVGFVAASALPALRGAAGI